MCCFSRPVRLVASTRIFARLDPGGRQALVYAMDYSAAEDLAMVLPLPVVADAGDDAVEFIDLSECADFFSRLDAHFPEEHYPQKRSSSLLKRSNKPKLKVELVGAFEASFVPTPADFDRLDPRFRLQPAVLDIVSAAQGFGYAVFKLRKTNGLKKLLGTRSRAHPMAFRFPRQSGQGLFFPTVHVHDGKAHETAIFDHQLYWQGAMRAEGAVLSDGRSFETSAMHGLVDPEVQMYRLTMVGPHNNQDVVLTEDG